MGVSETRDVTMRIDARDLAPTMHLNPYAPEFYPRGIWG